MYQFFNSVYLQVHASIKDLPIMPTNAALSICNKISCSAGFLWRKNLINPQSLVSLERRISGVRHHQSEGTTQGCDKQTFLVSKANCTSSLAWQGTGLSHSLWNILGADVLYIISSITFVCKIEKVLTMHTHVDLLESNLRSSISLNLCSNAYTKRSILVVLNHQNYKTTLKLKYRSRNPEKL